MRSIVRSLRSAGSFHGNTMGLGARAQRGDVDGSMVRVCRRVVRQNEDRRPDAAREVARHAVRQRAYPVTCKVLAPYMLRHGYESAASLSTGKTKKRM
jgi:hypothetical protein